MTLTLIAATSCSTEATDENTVDNSDSTEVNTKITFPDIINITNVAQNPEGIEFDEKDSTFFLSSLNATPIIKVSIDGSHKPFTNNEPFPMSTAGLQVDGERNRLLAAAFNGMELMDNDPNTKGVAHLRVYNLKTGVMEKDVNLSSLVPEASAYFANDVAIDSDGNAYITDWYAGVVYKVDKQGNPSIFAKNETGIKSGFNGIDYHPDGYLLVSLVSVNEMGLYTDYGLVKIPVVDPNSAELVQVDEGFTGFDGMIFSDNGNVIGITNNGTSPGGNTLIELSSNDNWKTAKIVNSKSISPSTTVVLTKDNENYVINQDFSPQAASSEDWTIQRINF